MFYKAVGSPLSIQEATIDILDEESDASSIVMKDLEPEELEMIEQMRAKFREAFEARMKQSVEQAVKQATEDEISESIVAQFETDKLVTEKEIAISRPPSERQGVKVSHFDAQNTRSRLNMPMSKADRIKKNRN